MANNKAEVEALVNAMDQAFKNKDANELAKLYTANATLIGKGFHLTGRDAIQEHMAKAMPFFGDPKDFKNEVYEINVADSAELASIIGQFSGIGADGKPYAGKYLQVLKRDSDGKFRVHHDIFTVDEAK